MERILALVVLALLVASCGASTPGSVALDGGGAALDGGGAALDGGGAALDGGGAALDGGGAALDGGPVDAGTPLEPGDPGAADVRFDVRSDRDLRPISPLIYGTNGADGLASNRQTVVRLGGNRWTAYNWENNASNAGSDYFFQNDGYLTSSNTPGMAVTPTVNAARAAGAATLVTIPIVDYVSADKNGGGDVRNTPNYLQARFRQNRPAKGAAFANPPNGGDGFVYQDEFVAFLREVAGSARILFSLDNEPDLWSYTHAEVHPAAVGYDELCQRNVDYARAIKAAWPEAEVTGFVSYGWYGYLTLQDAPDRAGKGEFIDYYLGRMKAAELQEGRRLVDYLDLHWYPEARGGGVRITGTETGAAVVAARVQAPRSLWDPSYRESSWIDDTLGGPIALVPRVRARIDAAYPGTKLAITEWNYGGGGHVSGAVAVADVLGVFGRQGVDLATYWFLGGDERFALAAFRAYRNFDGQGGAFGDTSLHAASSDVATATVYASFDAGGPDRVVIVAVNKATAERSAGITIAHPRAFATARTYRLTAAAADLVEGPTLDAVAQNAFRYDMPALSVSVIVPVAVP